MGIFTHPYPKLAHLLSPSPGIPAPRMRRVQPALVLLPMLPHLTLRLFLVGTATVVAGRRRTRCCQNSFPTPSQQQPVSWPSLLDAPAPAILAASDTLTSAPYLVWSQDYSRDLTPTGPSISFTYFEVMKRTISKLTVLSALNIDGLSLLLRFIPPPFNQIIRVSKIKHPEYNKTGSSEMS